jgi:DNA-binding NarL/FixJ family response regulator
MIDLITLHAGSALLILLTVLDLTVLGVFILFMKKMKAGEGREKLLKATEVLESLITESTRGAEQLREAFRRKEERMRRLSEHLDERAMSLRVLCNRAETLLQGCRETAPGRAAKASLTGRETKIIALARNGRRTEEIAGHLALAKEEVELVLGLEQKLARLGAEKVGS